ncbi:hypothetical protein SBV1_160020 [Verrucomicrobia bacterium]|nr:hypothetical protein SBV1_160020 [Verrucomicrobiota bacterium]
MLRVGHFSFGCFGAYRPVLAFLGVPTGFPSGWVWDGNRHNEIKLWSLCGPGDDGEPVITIMLEGED